jgi:ankyrin repeat protein
MNSNQHAHRRRFVKQVFALAAASCAPLSAFAGAYEDFFKAATMDDASTIKSLLARGFDPNSIEPKRGETGLMIAIREDSKKVIDVLLDAKDIDYEVKARNGDTALMLACYKPNKAVVQALLDREAEVNRPGWTPLHYAAAAGDNDIVQMLLDHSAYIDAESPNKTTPLMMAVLNNHIYTVKLLLDEGADATLRNEKGLNAIDIADMYGFNDISEGLKYRLKKAGKL